MKNEKFNLSAEGVHRLEYAVNYVLHNVLLLNNICGDFFVDLCDTEGNEVQRANAFSLVKNSAKIGAVVNTMGDMLSDTEVLLQAVIGELYGKDVCSNCDEYIDNFASAWVDEEIRAEKEEYPELFDNEKE